jgi:16S rRNA (guanine966-N2)-methyltransferase
LAEVVNADALKWLQQPPQPFDIVFLDPPFAESLLPKVLPDLLKGWVKPGGWLYLEADARKGLPELPDGLSVEKDKRMGEVVFALVRVYGDTMVS